MTTGLLLFSSNRTNAITLIVITAFLFGLFASTSVQAQEEVAEGSSLSASNGFYEGTVNFVHVDSSTLIVDDYSFVLAPNVRFNNAFWSREQAIQRIRQGNRLKLELNGVTGDRSGVRIVQSIMVVDE